MKGTRVLEKQKQAASKGLDKVFGKQEGATGLDQPLGGIRGNCQGHN